jgi:hypothetical protein
MLKFAFKEWAMVCQALADGRQSLIIRKGGIAEEGGAFKPEHDRFWLYPTYFHQQEAGVKPAAAADLRRAVADRPPEGVLRLSHFARVEGVHFVRSLGAALALDDLHVWSPDTLRQRFHYRTPGLYVLPVRVYEVPAVEVVEHPAYAGCKTWVELDRELPTEGATPVMSDEAFAVHLSAIRHHLTGADG